MAAALDRLSRLLRSLGARGGLRVYFERLLGDDPQDFSGLIAEVDGRPVGLTHYVFHRHGWRVENVCYLQDLYADPEVRGRGVGRALIEAVYAEADARDARRSTG
jgi:GNAT superfamily N-acetyltransferase